MRINWLVVLLLIEFIYFQDFFVYLITIIAIHYFIEVVEDAVLKKVKKKTNNNKKHTNTWKVISDSSSA